MISKGDVGMYTEAFGVMPEVGSLRIYDYEQIPKKEIAAGAESVTEYTIPEDRLPRVLNQGNVGSCVAHAVIEVLEILNYIETGEKVKLSPGYFYGHHRSETSVSRGMLVGNAIDRTRKHGSVPETMFREHVEMPEMRKIAQDREDLEPYAEKYKITSYVTFNNERKDEKWAKIKEAFLTYELPMVAVAPSYFGESHCIVLIGFEEKDGVRKLKFQNSWGTNYGDNGRSTIGFDKISSIYLLFDDVIKLPFNDVPESAWYYKNILNMYSAGLINGVSKTEFNPEGNVTRAELCAIIDRLTKKIDEKDAAMIESVYKYIDRK